MGIRNKIVETMETTTREMKIQSTKVVLNGSFNYCNTFGHKQSDCYKEQRNEQADFNGTCNYYNKFGHKQEDCRTK